MNSKHQERGGRVMIDGTTWIFIRKKQLNQWKPSGLLLFQPRHERRTFQNGSLGSAALLFFRSTL